MSDAIAVLVTSVKATEKQYEYRVLYLVDDSILDGSFNFLTGAYDYAYLKIFETFGHAKVYLNGKEAMNAAEDMALNFTELDNGIIVFSKFKEMTFQELAD